MPRVLPFAIIYLVPLSLVTGYLHGGIFTLTLFFIAFVLVPLLDLVIGADKDNPPEEAIRAGERAAAFKGLLWAYVPVHMGVFLWALTVPSGGRLGAWEMIGFTISTGVMTGAMGINVAHEFVHRPGRLEQFLGRLLLVPVGYLHFAIEHVHGHHRHVSTPRDPASSRLGESFYAFWPRTVIGSWRSAWDIECARMAKLGLPTWHPRNEMLWFTAIPVVLAAGVYAVFGAATLAFFVAQAVVGFSLLEIVNYLEHYGLSRRETGEGRYERVHPRHSWNDASWLTNRFLINLQRHSDHHANAARRYQELRHLEDAPQLPTGYAGMVLVALVPPLWFHLMDKRVAAYRKRLEENPELASNPGAHAPASGAPAPTAAAT